MKNKKEVSNDFYKVLLSQGATKDQILSLGYVGMSTDSLEELTVEQRNIMFTICSLLHASISEELKPKQKRNEMKMYALLESAASASNEFHKQKSDTFLMHSLNQHT
jgi:hypothetical protein